VFGDKLRSNSIAASKPPAEPPMPTIGQPEFGFPRFGTCRAGLSGRSLAEAEGRRVDPVRAPLTVWEGGAFLFAFDFGGIALFYVRAVDLWTQAAIRARPLRRKQLSQVAGPAPIHL